MNPQVIRSVGLVLIGAGIGSAATYFLTKNKIEKAANERADREVQSVKESYETLAEVRDNRVRRETLEVARKEAKEQNEQQFEALVKDLDYSVQGDEDDPVNWRVINNDNTAARASIVEAHPDDEYLEEMEEPEDQSLEAAVVHHPVNPEYSSDTPYVISVEEFQHDRQDFDKTTITYYDLDDTLCDEREQPIPDVDYVVGRDSLEHFGDRSDDPNIVYVRNEKLGTDYEVMRDMRSYTSAVLGYDDEPETKKKSPPRKLRDDG
jgi:hypothetical protein